MERQSSLALSCYPIPQGASGSFLSPEVHRLVLINARRPVDNAEPRFEYPRTSVGVCRNVAEPRNSMLLDVRKPPTPLGSSTSADIHTRSAVWAASGSRARH